MEVAEGGEKRLGRSCRAGAGGAFVVGHGINTTVTIQTRVGKGTKTSGRTVWGEKWRGRGNGKNLASLCWS